MKQVFLDTNVFIDYLTCREGFYVPAATIVSLAEKGYFKLLVSSLSFATGSYVLESHYHKTQDEIVQGYKRFLEFSYVTKVDESTVRQAIEEPLSDFEDAMQYHSATAESADCIITRDLKHFASSSIKIMTPQDFLKMITALT